VSRLALSLDLKTINNKRNPNVDNKIKGDSQIKIYIFIPYTR